MTRQASTTDRIRDLTEAIESARRALQTDPCAAWALRLKQAELAYRDYLAGLNGLSD